MSFKVFSSCLAIWVFMALLGGIFDGQFTQLTVDPTTQELTTGGDDLNEVMSGQAVNFKSNIGPIPLPISVPVPNPAYFVAIFHLASFHFSFFTYNIYTEFVRWLFLIFVAGPVTYKVLELVLPSVFYLLGQAASAIGSFIQRFIPIT